MSGRPLGREKPDTGEVRQVFQGIAPIYDLGNRLMTLGLWSSWVRALVGSLPKRSDGRYLDVGCGTGDLSLELAASLGPEGRVEGIDIAPAMLAEARRKASERGLARRTEFREADALKLPFDSALFDGVVSAFVLRSLPEREAALGEMRRVLRPGGILGILELSRPESSLVESFLAFYLFKVVPALGQLLAGRGRAYGWLGTSFAGFPDARELAGIIGRAGFKEIRIRHLGLGAVAIHLGRKGIEERKDDGTPSATGRLGSHKGL